MLEFIFEVLGEFLLQLVGEMLIELGLHSLAEPLRRPPNPWLAALGYLLFGSILGGLSLLVVAHHLVPEAWRIANLIGTPIAVGGLMALMGLALTHFWGALVLLGVGWNFGFIGATALLADCHRPSERAKVQALNDFLVFGTVAVASFGSGQLLHSVGWGGINAGMLPMVAVVLALLGWQSLRQRRGAATQG